MDVGKYTTLGWPWVTQWKPLLRDAILVARRLEGLGFRYDGRAILLINSGDEYNRVQ